MINRDLLFASRRMVNGSGLVRAPRMRACFRIRLLIMIIDLHVPRINCGLDEISARFDRRGREMNMSNMSESAETPL